MSGRLTVLLYAQALSGVGHYVRSFEIARSLARDHAVLLVDGGRRVPRPGADEVPRLQLPRIVRGAQGIEPLESWAPLEAVWAERAARLQGAIAALRPHVVVIEHYPFSKWDLASEVAGLLSAARAARPQVAVVCSVRDIVRQTRFEDCPADVYAARVLRDLERDFTAVMVHGEEALTPLAAHFPLAAALRIPVCYTGIVAERAGTTRTDGRAAGEAVSAGPYILVSSGGGSDPLDLAAATAAALSHPRMQGQGAHTLVVCRGLGQPPGPGRSPGPWIERPFSDDFLNLLAGAALSISYAGYNTCANVLATGRRALLAVHPAMSDQGDRAAIMQRLGAARVLAREDLAPQALAQSIHAALAAIVPTAAVRLDGAEQSAAFLAGLAAARAG